MGAERKVTLGRVTRTNRRGADAIKSNRTILLARLINRLCPHNSNGRRLIGIQHPIPSIPIQHDTVH